jgi:DNA polymerase III sliding clamp (beta) subunit (PCNA family)
MEVRVSKAEFSRVLAVFSKVVGKGRVWYLGYVGMSAGNGRIRLRGTDRDVYLRVEVPAEVSAEGGEFFVELKELLKLVKAFTEKELSLHLDGGWLVVQAGNVKSRLKAEVGDFPFPEFPQAVYTGTLPAEVLLEGIQRVGFASSKEDSWSLNCMLVDGKGEYANLVASDGHKLAIMRKAVPFNQTIKINRSSFPVLEKLLMKSGVIQIGQAEDFTFLADSGGRWEIAIRTSGASYPDYEAVIPTDIKTKVKLSIEDLKAFVGGAGEGDSLILQIENGGVKMLLANGQDAKAEAQIKAVVEGEPMTIGFRTKFIKAFTDIHKEGTVEMSLVDPEFQALFKLNDDYLYIVAPLKLK